MGKLITRTDTAIRLGVSYQRIVQMEEEGKLTGVRVNHEGVVSEGKSGTPRILESSIERYERERQIPDALPEPSEVPV